MRYKFFRFAVLTGWLSSAKQIFAGGGDGGGGDGGFTELGNYTIDVHSTSVTITDNETGVSITGTANPDGSFECTNGMTSVPGVVGDPQVSTPFLRVWDGSTFEVENDFLFGKPNTAFDSKEKGEVAYRNGIGGDTYILQTEPKIEHGHIKLQIREIEPEESFIDSFILSSIDLKPSERVVANGNLRDFHVFDTAKATTVSEPKVFLSRVGTSRPIVTTLGYSTLSEEGKGKSITLNTGDELLVRVPAEAIKNDGEDLFVLLDSHYRDWTLGDEVPFSRLEMFGIQMRALAQTSYAVAAGVAVTAGGFLGLLSQEHPVVPLTYADTPGGGGCVGDSCPCVGLGCSPWGRSLVVSVLASGHETYLETIFPRYARASQEVVRIPREILASLTDAFLTIRIRATKKHKVRAAFVFTGSPKEQSVTPLTLVSAVERRTGTDVGERLRVADGVFTHTIPGDVIDLTLRDTAPLEEGTVRRYVLQTRGFYTRVSEEVKQVIGKHWYTSLASDDRKILRSFRVHLGGKS